jgi:hypothetical protein
MVVLFKPFTEREIPLMNKSDRELALGFFTARIQPLLDQIDSLKREIERLQGIILEAEAGDDL